ncbi:hypothetical protein WKI68_08760 [Streptomyces sp. MS1.HAVA.3]|uniref:Uncharacterized protein n=1 Tax=Streptomyces caledonius TaxID=3134107 RepID=A0ABU8U2V1_9ACTN
MIDNGVIDGGAVEGVPNDGDAIKDRGGRAMVVEWSRQPSGRPA